MVERKHTQQFDSSGMHAKWRLQQLTNVCESRQKDETQNCISLTCISVTEEMWGKTRTKGWLHKGDWAGSGSVANTSRQA